MDLADLRDHHKRFGSTVYFTTIADSGFPAVTPVAVGWGDDGRVYAATETHSAKVKHLRARPEVTFHYAVGEQTGFDQLYVRGSAEVLTDNASRKQLWESGVLDYDLGSFFGSPENEGMCVIAITPERAVLSKQMGQAGREVYKPK